MKKLSLLFIAFYLLQSITIAQQGWFEQTSGTDVNLYRVFFLDEENGWVIGEKIIRNTANAGDDWTDKTPDMPSSPWMYFKSIWFTNSVTGYIGCYYAQGEWTSMNPYSIKTFNGGTTWEYKTSFVLKPRGESGINDVFFIDDMTGWMVRGQSVYSTSEGIAGSFSYAKSLSENLYSIQFINQSVGWVAGNNGLISKTSDGGETWNEQPTQITEDLKSVYFVNSLNGWAVGYSDTNSVIIKSTDGGETWYQVNYPSTLSLHCIQFVNENIGWACGSKVSDSEERGVILYTNDGGENWSEQYVSNISTSLNSLSFPTENYGWAAGSNGTILKCDVSTDIASENNSPKDYSLYQNYPNPFNPNTTINYAVKERGFVQLKVYDVLGNEVATLVNEEKQLGNYSVSFNKNNLPSGVYVYSLRVNNFVQNRKMILLK